MRWHASGGTHQAGRSVTRIPLPTPSPTLAAHLYLIFRLGAAAAQSTLELVEARRRDEEEARVEARAFHNFGALRSRRQQEWWRARGARCGGDEELTYACVTCATRVACA